ncbi:MAG: hypothetical protein Q7K42_05180 [Candidatus Diapherotrites archaeon]|nr:hypothetical protein [Candidatus Diapherotrites archaeon]
MAEKEQTLSSQQIEHMYRQEINKYEMSNRKRDTLGQMMMDTEASLAAVNEIKKHKESGEILVPLGAGVYVEAVFKDVKKVKTSLLSNIMKDSTLEEALEGLEKRKTELNDSLNEVQKEQTTLITNITNLEKIIDAGRRAASEQFKKQQANKSQMSEDNE